jgi:hypothetical protein
LRDVFRPQQHRVYAGCRGLEARGSLQSPAETQVCARRKSSVECPAPYFRICMKWEVSGTDMGAMVVLAGGGGCWWCWCWEAGSSQPARTPHVTPLIHKDEIADIIRESKAARCRVNILNQPPANRASASAGPADSSCLGQWRHTWRPMLSYWQTLGI